MLLLGHIGITAFTSSLLFLPALFAVGGALLPDIIDKGLFELGVVPCTRLIAHSIFFFPIAGLAAYGITRNKKIALAVALGAFLHLVEDVQGNVPLLYPLKEYAFLSTCRGMHISFSPYFIITETIGGLLTIFVFGFRDKFALLRGYFWRNIYRMMSWIKK